MDTHGHVSSVCTLNHFTCAPSSIERFWAGKPSISRTILISFGFSDLPRASAPLCKTDYPGCLTGVDVRQQQPYEDTDTLTDRNEFQP